MSHGVGFSSRYSSLSYNNYAIFRKPVILFLLLCLMASTIECIEVEETIRAKPYIKVFHKFGFEANGTLSINKAKIDPKSAYDEVFFYFCSDGQWRDLLSYFQVEGNSYGICKKNYSLLASKCEISGALLTDANGQVNSSLVAHRVKETDLYRLMLVHCLEAQSLVKTVDVTLKYTLLNPGGSQLSLGETPLPRLYGVMMACWLWLAGAWALLLILRRPWARCGVSKLHVLVEVVILSKLIVVANSSFYWRECAETGQCYDLLQLLHSFLFAISESALFCLLLLVAKGWKITRWRLATSEIRRIAVTLILLMSTLLFFSLYDESYYFLSLLIMYFFMLPKILTSLNRNARLLSSQIFFIAHLNQDQQSRYPSLGVLNRKLRLFKVLRVTVVLYLLAVLIALGLRLMISWYMTWVGIFVNELVVYVMLFVVAVLLHPRAVFARHNVNDLPLLNLWDLAERGELPDDDGDGVLDATVKFADGQTNDISEIVVFQYPVDPKPPQSSNELEEEDDVVPQERANSVSIAMYPLAVGGLEKFPVSSEQEDASDKEQEEPDIFLEDVDSASLLTRDDTSH